MTRTESQEGKVFKLIGILREITFAIQIAPFIYTVLHMVSIGIALSDNPVARRFADAILYVSPVLVITHLLYSRILHLCIWHRTACLLPLIPMAVSLADYFINLGLYSAIIIDIMFILMFGLLLVAAYNVFYVRR